VIRVGIMVNLSERWMGGVNYFANLVQAIQALDNRRIDPVIFVPSRTDAKLLAGFQSVEIIQTSLLDGTNKMRHIQTLTEGLLGRNYPMERLLRRARIDLLSHSRPFGSRSPVPTISWIADFQHRHLPEFFSSSQIKRRNRYDEYVCRSCSTLLLSSFNAQDDLFQFFPGAAKKSRVLQFVSLLHNKNWQEAESSYFKNRYKANDGYFHLPNQFWESKNHRVVIDALALLKARGVNFTVLATGNTQSANNPSHFVSLMRRAKEAGVEDRFRVLGLVPLEDLAGLMRGAIALINPSLFEGWSTTVEEAKSLGKTLILSDIPVHREQAPRHGIYFSPNDAEDLASAMVRVSDAFSETQEKNRREEAWRALGGRIQAFARRYEEIVLETR
jgi:glycosyltransferase involved in cell wall biosynthesis